MRARGNKEDRDAEKTERMRENGKIRHEKERQRKKDRKGENKRKINLGKRNPQ